MHVQGLNMNESTIYTKLKKKMPELMWNRIESSTSPGIPDMFSIYRHESISEKPAGLVNWIEAKKCKVPARDESKMPVKIQPTQTAWLMHARKNGARVFIAVLLEPVGSIRLMDGGWSVELAKGMTKRDFYNRSVEIYTGKVGHEFNDYGILTHECHALAIQYGYFVMSGKMTKLDVLTLLN